MSTSQGYSFFSITVMFVVHYGIRSHNGQGIPTVKEQKEHSEINSYIGYENIAVAKCFYYYLIFFSFSALISARFANLGNHSQGSTSEALRKSSLNPQMVLVTFLLQVFLLQIFPYAHPGWLFCSKCILCI